MNLYRDTPLAKAVVDLLGQLNYQIEQRFTAKPVSGAIKAYIFGGCAVHIYTNARGSNDLDVQIEATTMLDIESVLIELDTVYFDDPAEGESVLILDREFNIGLTPVMCPDYKARAIPLTVGEYVLHTYLVGALDIAISKLSRCAVDDVNDIISLFSKGLFSLDEFKAEAKTALAHTATQDSLRSNIEHVILKLESLDTTTSLGNQHVQVTTSL